MQGYYKTKIANIEKEYVEERNKRETRLKERIGNLEKKIQELND
jgi:ParB family chromosome partitioning protein